MKKLRVVIPKGSMQQASEALFADAGIPIIEIDNRTNRCLVKSKHIDTLHILRPQKIPDYLAHGLFDIAILGEDWIAERDKIGQVKMLTKFPLSRKTDNPVDIVLAVREESPATSVKDLEGKVISTEYQRMAEEFLEQNGVKARVKFSYGDTEQDAVWNVADAIVEATETGASLQKNRLRVIGHVFTSLTTVAANLEALSDPERVITINRFVHRIDGVITARKLVRLEADVPNAVLEQAQQIMPGQCGATVAPLGNQSNMSSLTAYIPRDQEENITDALAAIGVDYIAVIRNVPMITRKLQPS